MQPYNEDLVFQTNEKVKALYAEAKREPDAQYPVWVARTMYDYCAGSLWAASEAKHLRECREALGLTQPSFPPVTPPTGAVKLIYGAFHDARGPFNAIGVSFFPAAWGWKFDRARMLENADLIGPYLDYGRIWGQVAGGRWQDRTVNPDWPDYEQAMAETIDALHGKGMRTQVTIFAAAGEAGAETPDRRRRVLDQTLAYSRGREDKIMLYEIANESVGLEVDELRALARYLAERTTIPVAITSISQSTPGLYEGMRDIVDLNVVHYDRSITRPDGVPYPDGYDRPTRQPWGYPGEYYPHGAGTVPAQALDNEGIGPYSSVAEDRDPLRNVTRRVVAWIAGAPGSIYHCGPGIYFGGSEGIRRGHPANFWEVPGIMETLKGFGVLRSLLPQGISGWSRANHHWVNYPWVMRTGVGEEMFQSGVGCVRAYATISGRQVVCVPFGIRDHVTLGEVRPMDWRVHSLLTGEVLQEGTGTLTLPQAAGEAQLILGTFR